MPRQTIDFNGNTTVITYDSTGLFPNEVKHPSTNGVAHNDFFSYDANTGLVLSKTDENNQSTSFSYDNMRRITHAVYPTVGAGTPRTDFTYNDGSNTVTKTVAANPNPAQTTTDELDG